MIKELIQNYLDYKKEEKRAEETGTMFKSKAIPSEGAFVKEVEDIMSKRLTAYGKRGKKENVGKSDPNIEKLLGGELIQVAQKGSTMSGGRKSSDKMKKRGELIKKIMKERGVKLAEASKIIKNEGLM
jgi:hypothetical protein